jgi:HEAT repeat protein
MSRAFTELLQEMLDADREVESLNLVLLSDLDSELIQEFMQAWDSMEPGRRRTLVKKLGELADHHVELTYESINQIVLDDGDEEVRRIAIRNLWESDDPALVDKFIRALSDPADGVRAAAADALGHFVYLGEMEEIPPDMHVLIEESLLRTIRDEASPDARCNAIQSAGYSSSKEAEDAIHIAFRSSDEKMKTSAIIAMGRSANKAWGDTVIGELHSRREAACSAGELELRAALEPLTELLDDVDQEVRLKSIWALGQIGGDASREALETLFENEDDETVLSAIEDSMDHIAFLEGTRDLLFFDVDDEKDQID